MDDANFDGIMAGLEDALAYTRGDSGRARVVRAPDIKAIRKATQLSQGEFAKTFQLPVGTIRDWEQGRRRPDTGSTVLLRMIAADPQGVKRIIAKA